jgi:GTP-binding protein
VVIIDARREEIPDSDLQMIEFLQAVDVPCIPVFTKVDKLNRSALARVRRLTAKRLPPEYPPVFFSAVTKEGKQELEKQIAVHIG